MTNVDFSSIRAALAQLPSDHDASGAYRPTVNEIFAPRRHAIALATETPIVVGARGAGKSFWAGVLLHPDTRKFAAQAYPQLNLESVLVEAGYTGIAAEGAITKRNIDALVKTGDESTSGYLFWLAVIIRATRRAVNQNDADQTLKQVMLEFSDPEDAERTLSTLDRILLKKEKTLIVTFDALDTISTEWKRSRDLLDALFEVIWSLRALRAIRGKLFIRPEQFNDETLQFVELPKLRARRIELEWSKTDLYGMMFAHLFQMSNKTARMSLKALALECEVVYPTDVRPKATRGSVYSDDSAQKSMMNRLAGLYMGRGAKKGGTYDWPYNHLGDANGNVTPRSFLKLFSEAAIFSQDLTEQAISPDGIRHGLREASRVRVDQLVLEYPWIKRAIAPLAGVTVPCDRALIFTRWKETRTVKTILSASASQSGGFLPPFAVAEVEDPQEGLLSAMEDINVLSERADGRIDMPDLFRVAALMLKRGGTTPLKH